MQCRVIVTSCQKNAHLWESIRNNVGENLAFIYTADEQQQDQYVMDHTRKLLTIRTSDTYDNLPSKVILALTYWKEHYNDTHVLKLDDDCSLTGPLPTSLPHYGGTRIHGKHGKGCVRNNHFGRVPHGSYWFNRLAPENSGRGHAHVHGGNGVFFSRKSVNLILKRWHKDNLDDLRHYSPYEDVTIAEVLWKSGILPSYVNANIRGDHPHKP